MFSTTPRLLLPLAVLFALGACSTGQHADPQLSEMYKCNGAATDDSYSICDKKTHLDQPFVPPHHNMVSDMRAKEDIRLVGRTFDGLNVYTFRYKGDDVTQMGVMAQEVAKVHPDAVVPLADGYLSVDYSRIGRPAAP
jgi:hypothetical protein